MLPGVFQAARKDGTRYYRSSITYQNTHISLGSYETEPDAHRAYCEAGQLLQGTGCLEEILEAFSEGQAKCLPFEKCIILLNFRDHKMYIPTPIYIRKNYFSYFLSPNEELKFDIDDLFYYSQRKIMRRKGHLFVNDYGMQITLLSRYGIKSHAVCHRDYEFANGDSTDLRYANIIILSHYHGVTAYQKNGQQRYRVKIHINGNYTVGTYSSEEKAAIAYNKAADLAKKAGINRNYPQNYIESLTASEYADLYTNIRISPKYLEYLNCISCDIAKS